MRDAAAAVVLIVAGAFTAADGNAWVALLDSAWTCARAVLQVRPVTRMPAHGPRSFLAESQASRHVAEADRTRITLEPLEVSPGPVQAQGAPTVPGPTTPAPERAHAATRRQLQMPPLNDVLALAGVLCLAMLVGFASVAVTLLRRGVVLLDRARTDLAFLAHRQGEANSRPSVPSTQAGPLRQPGPSQPPGHELPTRLACELSRMRERLLSMSGDDAAVVGLRHTVERLSLALQAAGYEVKDRRGELLRDGMAMQVATYTRSADLLPGEQRVARMIKPEVRYRGVVIAPGLAEVEVGGPCPGPVGGADVPAQLTSHDTNQTPFPEGGLPWTVRR